MITRKMLIVLGRRFCVRQWCSLKAVEASRMRRPETDLTRSRALWTQAAMSPGDIRASCNVS